MTEFRGYRDLDVWKKALDFVADCYQSTKQFPGDERFGLSTQLQRAAVSVPANIAEGHLRGSTKEFLYHLNVAYGSLMEAETHLQIACRLEYITADHLHDRLEKSSEIGRMLNGLKGSLQRRLKN